MNINILLKKLQVERHSADLKLLIIRTLMEWTAAVSSCSFPSVFAFIDGCV